MILRERNFDFPGGWNSSFV